MSMELITNNWTDFKTIVANKLLQMQYYNNGTSYMLWAIDGASTYYYTIWQAGSEPINSNISQFAAERADFINNFQAACNFRATSSSSFGTIIGTIAANGQIVAASIVGASGAIITMHGTYSAISGFFEISDDNGITWYPIFGSPTGYTSSYSNTLLLATNALLMYEFDFIAATNIRFRCSAYTSGTMIIRITPASNGPTVSTISVGDVLSGNTENATSAPVKIGGVAQTILPTAVANGQRVNAIFDTMGRQVVVSSPREMVLQNSITVTTTAETTLLAAAGAGVFVDLTVLILTNLSATAAPTVSIRDATGGTVRQVYQLTSTTLSGCQMQIVFEIPWTQTTANNNWTVKLSVTDAAGVTISAQGIQTN